MDFDTYTVALLVRPPAAPQLDDSAAATLQDAHMAHLADLHDAGCLLAAGPLSSGSPEEPVRGLLILNVASQRAGELLGQDPAVQAGVLSAQVFSWMVPAGAMSFTPARFPRSMQEI